MSLEDIKMEETKGEISHVECRTAPTLDSRSHSPSLPADLEYAVDDIEPVLQFRTYLALAALFILNYVQIVALTGPPTILDYIGKDLNGTKVLTWVPNALSLVQAVGGPVISFASDTFQARKTILVGTCTVSFIGAAIAPGAKDVYRVIVAQILIGVGFAAVPLAYSIPSGWRPIMASVMNIAGALGAITGPLVGGAMTRISLHYGWRNFYWVQMGLWGATVLGILVGYHPPKRHTRLDHLSVWQKIGYLDLPGMGLLTVGVTLLLTGLSLGGNPYPWSDARVLATLVSGIVVMTAFGIYEWKGTSRGILHHELFVMRTFPLCIALIFIEGILLFTIIVFYPAVTTALFESEPLLLALRTTPFWIGSGLSTIGYGFWSAHQRTIKAPLIVGYAILTAGVVGMATIQPGQSTRAIIFDALAGCGLGAPVILIIAGVQLSIPHHLIATATAVVTSSRAVAAATFTAIYSAAVGNQMKVKLPKYVAAAALAAGLPAQYLMPFIGGIAEKDPAAVSAIPGITPNIVEAGIAAANHAIADSFRIVYIIAAPFGVVACIICFFLDDLKAVMTYRVDAPVEELHAKQKVDESDV